MSHYHIDLLSLTIILFIAFLTVIAKKLTIPAAITGSLLGFSIFCSGGVATLSLLAAFFIIGTLVTSWKSDKKLSLKLQEENDGRRTTGQVLANGGLAGTLACISLIFPEFTGLVNLMIAAAFSAATSDTVSSELGNVYGRHFYNMLNLKKDTKGLDGVVSLEGTLLGMLGAIVIALIYVVGFGWSSDFYLIVIAGTIGNLVDSILGASLERRKLINNDLVNFLNTSSAVISILIMRWV